MRLELRGVRKRYAGRDVLAGIDLVVPPGRTTVLLGPSGCGKSTILRLLVGLIRPDAGDILLDGSTLDAVGLVRIRSRFGYVIQDGGLFPHLTARGNVVLAASCMGRSPTEMDARLRELAELTRFPADALDRWPAQLSGGQKQRVGLMRALFLDPAVLLLDEPLGALDPLIRAELQDDLRRIFRALNKTVVLVTHDLGEADHFADDLVLMREGRIVQSGSLQTMWTTPADPFVRTFIEAQRGPTLTRETA